MKHSNHFARVVYQIILFGSIGPEWYIVLLKYMVVRGL